MNEFYYYKCLHHFLCLGCLGQPSSFGCFGLCHVLLLPPLQQPHPGHAAAQCQETRFWALALTPQVRMAALVLARHANAINSGQIFRPSGFSNSSAVLLPVQVHRLCV